MNRRELQNVDKICYYSWVCNLIIWECKLSQGNESLLKFGGLNRPIDPRYATNLAILLLASLIGSVSGLGMLGAGESLAAAFGEGFYVGAAIFFSWAICREVDPDHEYSAFVAAGLAGLAHWQFGTANVLGLLAFVSAARLVNRVTGQKIYVLDLTLPVGSAVWLATRGEWLYLVMVGICLLLDARLPNGLRYGFGAGLVLIISGVAGWSLNGAVLSGLDVWRLGYVVIVGLLWGVFSGRYTSGIFDDAGENFLNLQRVQTLQWLVYGFAAAAAVIFGASSLPSFGALWAAILGSLLYGMGSRYFRSEVRASRDAPGPSE